MCFKLWFYHCYVQARSQNCEQRLLVTSCLSVCNFVRASVRVEQLGFHWTDFHEIYLRIFRKSVKKIQVSLKSDKNNLTLHEGRYTFLIISRSFLLKMRNVSDKNCKEHQNIYFVFSNFFF